MLCLLSQVDAVSAAAKVADSMGEKSDRVVMLFLLIFLIVSMVWAVRWITSNIVPFLKAHLELATEIKVTMERVESILSDVSHFLEDYKDKKGL